MGSTIEKIVEIDNHLACAFSGLTADSKMLIERARVEAQNHWFNHDRQMPVESIAQSVSNLAIQFGDSDSDGSALSRPFGVALLFAGSEGAQQSLQEVFHKGMTMKEAIKHALSILKQVMEEKLSESNVEVSTVTKDKGFQLFKGD